MKWVRLLVRTIATDRFREFQRNFEYVVYVRSSLRLLAQHLITNLGVYLRRIAANFQFVTLKPSVVIHAPQDHAIFRRANNAGHLHLVFELATER